MTTAIITPQLCAPGLELFPTPKGSARIIDDEHMAFADLFFLKTRENLEKNPKVTVTLVDMQKYKGYQFKGSAQLVDSGPTFDKVVE